MFGKKRYIILVLVIAFSSIFTWLFLYGDFPHRSPVGAKQVFYINSTYPSDLVALTPIYRRWKS
jgi:uncharacterized ion transporter superfamily protein YfcC